LPAPLLVWWRTCPTGVLARTLLYPTHAQQRNILRRCQIYENDVKFCKERKGATTMTTGTGFGKVQTPKKSSQRAEKRAKAAQQYEKMKTDGMPEFNIYIRIQDKKNWYPVGSLAVSRSSQINKAIFDSAEELRQGAFRLFPVLRKNQQNLEYGYRLKGADFADEPIELAVEPQPSPAGFIQEAIDRVKDSFSALLKKQA
jgi:hypothetical protein